MVQEGENLGPMLQQDFEINKAISLFYTRTLQEYLVLYSEERNTGQQILVANHTSTPSFDQSKSLSCCRYHGVFKGNHSNSHATAAQQKLKLPNFQQEQAEGHSSSSER